jgi:hypothetical protein
MIDSGNGPVDPVSMPTPPPLLPQQRPAFLAADETDPRNTPQLSQKGSPPLNVIRCQLNKTIWFKVKFMTSESYVCQCQAHTTFHITITQSTV